MRYPNQTKKHLPNLLKRVQFQLPSPVLAHPSIRGVGWVITLHHRIKSVPVTVDWLFSYIISTAIRQQ